MSTKKPVVIGGKLKLKGSSSSSPSSASKPSSSASTGSVQGSLPNSAAITGKKRPLEITPDDVLRGDVEVSVTEASGSYHLTDAQRRVKDKQRQLEERQLKKLAAKPYRERVEEYNEKLSKLTEHNDIPRVSAAGNG